MSKKMFMVLAMVTVFAVSGSVVYGYNGGGHYNDDRNGGYYEDGRNNGGHNNGCGRGRNHDRGNGYRY